MVINWQRARFGSTAAIPVAVTVILWASAPTSSGPVAAHVTQFGVEPLTQTLETRITQAGVEAVPTLEPQARITQLGVEAIPHVDIATRITAFGVEVVIQERGMRVTQVGVEVIQRPVESCEMQVPPGEGGEICSDEMTVPTPAARTRRRGRRRRA